MLSQNLHSRRRGQGPRVPRAIHHKQADGPSFGASVCTLTTQPKDRRPPDVFFSRCPLVFMVQKNGKKGKKKRKDMNKGPMKGPATSHGFWGSSGTGRFNWKERSSPGSRRVSLAAIVNGKIEFTGVLDGTVLCFVAREFHNFPVLQCHVSAEVLVAAVPPFLPVFRARKLESINHRVSAARSEGASYA